MSLKQTSETVSAKRRIAQIITQWVPGSRASNSKCPTRIRAEAVSRYNQVMTPSRTKMLSTGHIRDGNAAVHQVLASLVMEAVVHHWHEFKLNSLWHVEPMQVNMHKLRQATIKLALSTLSTLQDQDQDWKESMFESNWVTEVYLENSQ